jgi:hypothetical protein
MPRISEFYGIVIAMYFSDHPTPHFHAAYGEHEAKVAIRPFGVIEGSLPVRKLRLVRRWVGLHEDELLRNWEGARRHGKLSKIDPLP